MIFLPMRFCNPAIMNGLLGRPLFSLLLLATTFVSVATFGQLRWQNVDSAFGSLPPSVHVYFTEQQMDTAPFRAYYLIADLRDKSLDFTTDTTLDRRLTPSQFYAKNEGPLAVVNGTFFSFETNRNLNLVMKDGRVVAHGLQLHRAKADTALFAHHLTSAIGISKRRKPDVAWVYSDTARRWPVAFSQQPRVMVNDRKGFSIYSMVPQMLHYPKTEKKRGIDDAWKMRTALGGGPVLLHEGNVRITNEEEFKFTGKAVNDKHPRTAMGYTADGKLIILVVEGRNKASGGATLTQEAQILKDLRCVEALNLDGGGSSCLLVNGKETIKPSDKEGQRPVPAVFLIKRK